MHEFPSGAFLLPAIEGYCSIKFESEAPRDSNPLGGSYPIYHQCPCGLRNRTANRTTERRNRTVFTFHRASEIKSIAGRHRGFHNVLVHHAHDATIYRSPRHMFRVGGVEPPTSPFNRGTLPLRYTRLQNPK